MSWLDNDFISDKFPSSKKNNENNLGWVIPDDLLDIYTNIEERLSHIDKWKEYRNAWDWLLEKNNKGPTNLNQLSAIFFSREVKENTDLLKIYAPTCPPDPQNANELKDFQIAYRDYLKKYRVYANHLIEIAPQALEKIQFGLKVFVRDGIDELESYRGEDPQKWMNLAFYSKKAKEWDSAIMYLRKSYKAMNDLPSDLYRKLYLNKGWYINSFLRLPLYLHQGGYKKEAWKVFNEFLSGKFPVKNLPKISGRNADYMESWELRETFDKMRVSSERERDYKKALVCRCASFYSMASHSFFEIERDKIEEEGLNVKMLNDEYKSCISKENILFDLEKGMKKANTTHIKHKLVLIIKSALKKLPDFKNGLIEVLSESGKLIAES